MILQSYCWNRTKADLTEKFRKLFSLCFVSPAEESHGCFALSLVRASLNFPYHMVI